MSWDPHDSEHNPYWWEREEAQRAEEPAWDERPSAAELALDQEERRRRAEARQREGRP